MFKTNLLAAGSLMFAVAQGVVFKQGDGMFLGDSGLALAQTDASQYWGGYQGNSCCCSMMPCMPTCVQPCPKEEPSVPKPIIIDSAPEPIKNIVLNLDVILTHIMHEVHPDPEIPEYTPPPPSSPDEHSFVQNVLTPIVIQLLNNDVVPAIPTCTFPEGTSAADFGLSANGSPSLPSGTPSLPTDTSDSPAPVTHLPDPKAIIRGVLEASLHKFKIPEAIDSSQLIDAAIPSDEIIAQLDIASPDGKK